MLTLPFFMLCEFFYYSSSSSSSSSLLSRFTFSRLSLSSRSRRVVHLGVPAFSLARARQWRHTEPMATLERVSRCHHNTRPRPAIFLAIFTSFFFHGCRLAWKSMEISCKSRIAHLSLSLSLGSRAAAGRKPKTKQNRRLSAYHATDNEGNNNKKKKRNATERSSFVFRRRLPKGADSLRRLQPGQRGRALAGHHGPVPARRQNHRYVDAAIYVRATASASASQRSRSLFGRQ